MSSCIHLVVYILITVNVHVTYIKISDMCNGNADVQGATIVRAYYIHVYMSQGCVHIHMMICYTNFDIIDYNLNTYHVTPEIHHLKTSVSCAPSTCCICGVRAKRKRIFMRRWFFHQNSGRFAGRVWNEKPNPHWASMWVSFCKG